MPQPTFKQQLDFNHAKAILKAIKGNVNSKKVVSLLDTMFKDEKQILTAVKNVSSNSANFVKQALPDKTNPTFGGKILGVLNSMKDIVEKAIGTAWTKVTELSPTNKYIVAGLFGSFILFAIYKLLNWLKTPKKEEELTTEQFNDNFIMFRSKMIEGTDFLETLTQRIRESDEPVMGSNIIAKALPLADQASDFVLNEEQTEKKSFIKKYGYAILAGVACIASILVYWFYFKANPAAAIPNVLPNGTPPGDMKSTSSNNRWNQTNAGPGDTAGAESVPITNPHIIHQNPQSWGFNNTQK